MRSSVVTIAAAVAAAILTLASEALGHWAWAVRGGGASNDVGTGIAIDSAGNSYVTGSYQGTATFGVTTLTSVGSSDVFVAKVDFAGNYLWAVSGGGASNDVGTGIAIDSAGNSYVTGSYQGTASFGAITLDGSGVFVAKLDPNGSFVWATSGGGPFSDSSKDIAVDDAGNSYITGSYFHLAYFGDTQLSNPGSDDAFVAKLDASGSFVWAVGGGGASNDFGNDIAVDDAGNSYVTGTYFHLAYFGATTLTSAGGDDVFVAKVDSTGNYLWAVSGGGASYNDWGLGIAVDSAGNSYVTGSYRASTTFGVTTLTSAGGDDVFVAKVDSTGNYLWAVSGGGASNDVGSGIAVDSAGNSYVTGYYQVSATFGVTTLTSVGSLDDVFVAKVDSAGDYLWAGRGGGGLVDRGYSVAVDSAGYSYVTGSYQATATFGATLFISAGGDDVFVAKSLGGDCNGNNIADDQDIANGTSLDCQGDGVPDECQLPGNDCNSNGVPDECDLDCQGDGIPDDCQQVEDDCNGNGVEDECDIAHGTSLDCQGDGIPDECQAPYSCVCADLHSDGVIDVDDLTVVILLWGSSNLIGDVDGDGDIDVDDLTAIIMAWGPCE